MRKELGLLRGGSRWRGSQRKHEGFEETLTEGKGGVAKREREERVQDKETAHEGGKVQTTESKVRENSERA